MTVQVNFPQNDGGGAGNGGSLSNPQRVYGTAQPVGIAPGAYVGANGSVQLLGASSPGGGTLTLSSATAGSGVTLTLSLAGTNFLAGSTQDNGKVFTINDGGTYRNCTVTAFGTTTTCTVTVNSTIAGGVGPWAAGTWWLVYPPPAYLSSSNIPGIWWYYPANVLFSGSAAGMYWTVMTSALLGTVYNNVRAASDPTTPPTTPTPIISAAVGVYAGPTGIGTYALLQFTLPANSLGPSGELRFDLWTSGANTASAKGMTIKLAASTVWAYTPGNTAGVYESARIKNRGVTNSQVALPVNAIGESTVSGVPSTLTVDTTVPQLVTIYGGCAASGDWAVSELFSVDVEYGA